ncbi:pullulanase-associated domain-containing protein [Marinicrinis sediminis]|uniref:Pullulanase-associated domain-containing protein n=1 Tax=Marinicrinis sediminis TaxID=1652465 RepID=A0ABW5REC7_9BACL
MKNMWQQKWIKLMVVVCCFALFSSAAYAEEKTEVIVHYKPHPENTIEWTVWAWGENDEGARFSFTGEDEFGKVAVIELPGKHEQIGYLISTEEWVKDGEDQFISLTDNKAEIFIEGTLVSGDSGAPTSVSHYSWMIVIATLAIVILIAAEYTRNKHRKRNRENGESYGSQATQ